MNQQPDKLFREKLEGHQQPVPASAWDKLEAGLDKKSNKTLWLKVAASLLLVAVAAYLLLSNGQLKSDQTGEHNVANNKTAIPAPQKNVHARKIDNAEVSNSLANENKLLEKNEANGTVSPPSKKVNASQHTVTSVQSEYEKTEAEKNLPAQKDQAGNSLAEASLNVTTSPKFDEVSSVAIAPSSNNKRKSITLVYTAEEVNEKFLDKNAVAEATTAEDKSSTLKTLLDKATDLTRDQDPVGELRQKKNEILALSFKKKNNVGKTDKTL